MAEFLNLDKSGEPYIKATVNLNLRQGALARRTKSGVEYRTCSSTLH